MKKNELLKVSGLYDFPHYDTDQAIDNTNDLEFYLFIYLFNITYLYNNIPRCEILFSYPQDILYTDYSWPVREGDIMVPISNVSKLQVLVCLMV